MSLKVLPVSKIEQIPYQSFVHMRHRPGTGQPMPGGRQRLSFWAKACIVHTMLSCATEPAHDTGLTTEPDNSCFLSSKPGACLSPSLGRPWHCFRARDRDLTQSHPSSRLNCLNCIAILASPCLRRPRHCTDPPN